jgi:hypothetical protein
MPPVWLVIIPPVSVIRTAKGPVRIIAMAEIE